MGEAVLCEPLFTILALSTGRAAQGNAAACCMDTRQCLIDQTATVGDNMDIPGNADWLWCGEVSPNSYVGFARQFEKPARLKSARIALFADTKYKLYVNGCFVNSGPAPFRKPVVMMDEYDIGPCLCDGLNTIFVLCHFIGSTVKYNTVDKPGLIASIDLDGQAIVTDTSWRAFPVTAWNVESPRKNWAIEHVEDIDLGEATFRILAALASKDYAAGEPVSLEDAMKQGQEPTVVSMPDIEYRARMVPPLRWRTEDAPRLEAVFRTNNQIHNLKDTSMRLDHEHVVPAWDQEVYDMTRGGTVRVSRRKGRKGYALLYDMRRMCAGEVSFEIECDCACNLDLALAEEVRNGRPYIWREGGYYFARFHLQPGINRCRFYHFNGHRYIYLVFKDLEGAADVKRVTTHHCRADLNYDDSFDSTDPEANAVYAISRRSLMLNTQANSYDCNTREQGAYWGDSLWILDSVGHMTGDFSHMRHMCYAMTDEYKATGMLSASLYGLGAPLYDYCLVAVDFLRRYHRYTGDVETVRDNLETAAAIVEDFRKLKDSSGLITLGKATKGSSELRDALLFLDHSGIGWHPMTTTGIDRDDYNCGINLFYLQALQALGYAYTVTGMHSPVDSEMLESRQLIRDYFFVPEKGLLTDAKNDSKTVFSYSQIVNALGVMTGVLDGDEAMRAMLDVVDIERHPWVSQGTPYTYFFLCEALAELGLPELGVATIKRYWRPMLQRGATTTWEAFGGENHDSLNHAWSAPLPYLIRKGVIGLEPEEPGYSTMFLEPCCRSFDAMSSTVMIPQGEVHVDWKLIRPNEYALKVSIPDGTEAVLCWGHDEIRFTGEFTRTMVIDD